MPTATLTIADTGGFAGPARTYRLDEPKDFGDITTEYVTIWIQPGFAHQDPEVALVPATASGAGAAHSLKRRPGSYVLHGNPDSPDYIDGAYWLALQQLGGYNIVAAPVEPAPVKAAPAHEGEFDPTQHIVSDVFDYLDTATPEERTRVIEAERNGKARKSILAKGK